jgi:[CysO sulfur-carrier protein]-S-L-cysteine hydrolase
LSTPFRLQVPRPIFAEMLAHARAELPNECCGLLAGHLVDGDAGRESRLARVVRCYPLVNAAASPREYLSDPYSMFAADKDMRRHGLDVLAVYHSHPTSEPVPSRTDLARNFSPDVVNFIISLVSPEPEVRGWWLTDRDYREAEWDQID